MERSEAASSATGKVLPFERRSDRARSSVRPQPGVSSASPGNSPVEGFGRYERGAGDTDDYWHRQKANFAALFACVLLVVAGLWIAKTMADVQRDQQCVLSGGKNCAQISITGIAKR